MNKALCIVFLFVCSLALGQTARQCSVGETPCTPPTSPPPPQVTNDGPAELPRVYLKSMLADQLSPGNTIFVGMGGNLSTAYASAKCGDILMLAHGNDFPVATLAAKNCDDAHTILIRSDALDSQLPTEGTRINPCYAGVASLPGRPVFSCPIIARVMPRIVLTGQQTVKASLDHARFLGINFYKTPGSGLTTAQVTANGANRVTFDRCWFQGSPKDENTRGLDLNGSRSIAVRDSYFSDFHCKAPGACSDSQAILGGITNTQDGPYQILNNHLEASAEVILFGGGVGTGTPADIEIKGNHLFKPLQWNPSDPSYFGTLFSVKNILEFKNGVRALVEGNVLENNWGGFSQAGFALTLTPKNAHARVSDITFRFNQVKHVAGFVQMANIAQSTTNIASDEGARYSIHDVTIEDVGYSTCYRCGRAHFQINDIAAEVMDGVSIDHITLVPAASWTSGFVMFMGGVPITNLKFTNSVFDAGQYGPWGLGGVDCTTNQLSPLAKFNSCWKPSYSFAGNVIARGMTIQQGKTWPLGNFFPTNMSAVGFMSGTDFHLAPTSLYKGKGTDGKDPGADIDAVLKATAGVQ